jgi:uncharacterized membrane protein
MKALIAIILFFAVAIGWAGMEVVESTTQPQDTSRKQSRFQQDQVRQSTQMQTLLAKF